MNYNSVNMIIARCLCCDENEISPEKHLVYDLLADSIALVDLSLELEAQFGFSFNEQHMQRLNTVGDVYKIVSEESIMSD